MSYELRVDDGPRPHVIVEVDDQRRERVIARYADKRDALRRLQRLNQPTNKARTPDERRS